MKDYTFDNSGATVELISWSANQIQFKTYSPTEQFLVVSEIFYPEGWDLNDGSETYKIFEVNESVRGFFVPSGEKHFIMTFNPRDVKFGFIISIISFSIIIFILLYQYNRRKNDV